MVYRVISIIALGVGAVSLLGIGVLMDRVSTIVHPGHKERGLIAKFLDNKLSPDNCLLASIPFLIWGAFFLLEPFIQYMRSGRVHEHWSSFALGYSALPWDLYLLPSFLWERLSRTLSPIEIIKLPSMESSLTVSVVVICLNEEQHISGILDSLAEQTLDKELFEVIIVDNQSQDRTVELAKSYESTFPTFVS